MICPQACSAQDIRRQLYLYVLELKARICKEGLGQRARDRVLFSIVQRFGDGKILNSINQSVSVYKVSTSSESYLYDGVITNLCQCFRTEPYIIHTFKLGIGTKKVRLVASEKILW